MTIQELIEKIKTFEGFRVLAYDDLQPNTILKYGTQIKGTLTIGYGRTENVYIGEVTTKEKEDEWLTEKVSTVYENVRQKMIGWGYYYLSTDQMLALTDFTYNLGIKNLNNLTDNGQRNISTISEKILLYNKCNGKVLNGLIKRRKWEHDLLTSGTKHLTNAEKLQIKINEMYKNFEVDKQIEVDGIIGNETISACIDIFNLL